MSSAEERKEEEDNVPPKKKKKKSEKKREKKKKHKKKSGRYSDSSGSDSDTIYPSDLKKEDVGDRYTHTFTSHILTLLISYTIALSHFCSVFMIDVSVVVVRGSMQAPGCSVSESFFLVG